MDWDKGRNSSNIDSLSLFEGYRHIPSNFIEKGKILNGTFDIRNAIESIVLSLAIGIPVFHLPLSLTARIIILCMTALPAAMVALIGIGGESITAFLMNALRFVVNRRVIWRSDSLPEGKPRRKPRFKEPKTKKHRKAEKMAEPSKVMASAPPQSEPDAPAPPKSKKKEHRQFDTSTKRGIKMKFDGSSSLATLSATRAAIGTAETPAAPINGLTFSLQNRFSCIETGKKCLRS